MATPAELLHAQLAQLPARVQVFCRDDDAGWADERLFALIDTFIDGETPLDLAVIPDALSGELAAALRLNLQAAPALLSVHQHGFSHTNHERSGRKCEFGAARSRAQQAHDIAQGAALLREQLNGWVAPIFTPPWNRHAGETCAVLVEQGFRAISTDRVSPNLSPALRQLAVRLDWSRLRRRPHEDSVVGAALSDAFKSGAPLGIMFHHADYNNEELRTIRDFLAVLRGHSKVQLTLMRNLLY